MTRSIVRSGICILIALLLLEGCDSTSEPVPLPGPIILITNQWKDEANENHVFALESENDDGESEGVFTGTEFIDITVNDEDDQHDLTGRWADGQIEFTVDRDGDETTYEATFSEDDPKRLSFTAGSETLVLIKEDL